MTNYFDTLVTKVSVILTFEPHFLQIFSQYKVIFQRDKHRENPALIYFTKLELGN